MVCAIGWSGAGAQLELGVSRGQGDGRGLFGVGERQSVGGRG